MAYSGGVIVLVWPWIFG